MVRFADQVTRDSLLERLDRNREGTALRLAEQKVNVLGHDDVSEDSQIVGTPDPFKRGYEDVLNFGWVQ